MLNFSGQAKRRNVNLGSRATRSKQDLLNDARKERERRALAKKDEESALVIQKTIRRCTSNKNVFKHLTQNMTSQKATQLIIAYPVALFQYLPESELIRALEIMVNDGRSVVNLRLTRLVEALGTHKCSLELLASIWAKFTTETSPRPEFVPAVVKFLTEASYTIPKEAIIKLVELIEQLRIPDTDSISELFGISVEAAQNASNPRCFLRALGTMCSPQNINNKDAGRDLIENLAYLFGILGTAQRSIYSHVILRCLTHVDQGCLRDTLYFKELYTRAFVDTIMPTQLGHVLEELSVFVSHAPNVDYKNNVLVSLVAKQDFMMEVHQEVFQRSLSEHRQITGAALLFETLNIYLSVASDLEVLHNKDSYPLQYLKEATDYLKQVCFRSLWNLNESGHALPDCYLNTLKKIHLRDSRLHFFPRSENSDYWSVTDNEFVNVNITKYIEEFELFYRDRVDNLDFKDEDTEDMELFEKKRSLRYEFLFEAEKSFVKRATTRQFKKLNILSRAPFFIPFQQRVDWLYFLISIDHKRLNIDPNDLSAMFTPWSSNSISSKQTATISREHLLEDAFNAYNPIGESFKSKLSVTFVNQFGPEAGIDGGGITKEFLTSVSDEGFKQDQYHLFKENHDHELYPSDTLTSAQHVKYLWFLGKVLGKCLYDHVLIDVNFADFFLKKLLNVNQSNSSFDDLASFDSALYSNLVKLLGMSADELQNLGLRFEITDEATLQTVDLVPNGSDIIVTKSNTLQYLFAVADFKLNRKLRLGTRSFTGGLYTMIPPHWLEMFNSIELQMLISGGGKDIDLSDLHRHSEYGDFSEQDQTIRDFWTILAEFEPQDRFKFVKFVTSVPRAPLQGFGSLNPLFGIRNAGPDASRLPTASTCVNLLKLPDYRNREVLRNKLLYAINAEARFDLS
ncbi:LANO_0G09054g1_1 [Lachancea nothofagi CBS 11611]|uniref:HECT-type E3 ubiquitin transferase n=1 Tax=Lachancea nothofagi CBS 11611 TaxID=1266666 RepID=A0A1G4KIF5_9SACH|nr:LANO_0G09054g1_1 [Lachancea nothofagi CBS 11611]